MIILEHWKYVCVKMNTCLYLMLVLLEYQQQKCERQITDKQKTQHSHVACDTLQLKTKCAQNCITINLN